MRTSDFFSTTGKTLILETSVKTLSQKENTKVFFVNALGKTLNTYVYSFCRNFFFSDCSSTKFI